MCGINGVVSWSRHPQPVVEDMNRHLGHRGPDGDGIYTVGSLAIGHVRLSILDLSELGAQPMRFDPWVLSYNGEIYNFKSLREELEAEGYSFVSNCDTEVLLKAWDRWGEECLNKLDGMFAFAIYNTESRCLYLCRDSYGVKPLFYSLRSDEFLFSSELSTLVNGHSTAPEIDSDAIATFLALHYVPAPQTGLSDVFKLPPGFCLKVNIEEADYHAEEPRMWHVPFQPKDDPEGISLDRLDEVLARSVMGQMVSDVPVGAFLSGGVDSSLICHYASKVHKEPLHTFSIGFSDAGQEYDETVFAAQAARIIGAEHHAVRVELGGLSDRIETILGSMGELNADTSVFLNHIVCEEARKYVTVCLSGAGGDEMFGGYFRHQALLALKFLKLFPASLTGLARSGLNLLPQNRDSRAGNLVRRLIRFLNQREAEGGFVSLLRQDSVFPQESAFLSRSESCRLEDLLSFDFTHFLGDNIFSFSDKMSMLHSLEVRVPFLDPQVVRLAEQMRNNQRVTFLEKKILLKKLAVRYFPKELIYRKKQGFAAPVEVWLRQFTEKELQIRCLEGLAGELISPDTVNRLIREFLHQRKDYSLQLYSLMVINWWRAGHR